MLDRLGNEGLSCSSLVGVSWVGLPPGLMQSVVAIISELWELPLVIADMVLRHVGASIPPRNRIGVAVVETALLQVKLHLSLVAESLATGRGLAFVDSAATGAVI